MGMFDTVYAKLDCPFCSRQYRYTPLSDEQAARECKEHKQGQLTSRQKFLQGEINPFNLQHIWARQAGFEEVEAWIDQLDTPAQIEAHRTRSFLGLAEIQTKEFENVLAVYYVGDEIPSYSGHYYIPEAFCCTGCSTPEESVYVSVWLEIEDRKLQAVRTHDPETGQPAREVFPRKLFEVRPPDPHPPLHFNHRGLQAHARYNAKTRQYDLEVHYVPERFRYSHPDEEFLRTAFQSFADDYLDLLGGDPGESSALPR